MNKELFKETMNNLFTIHMVEIDKIPVNTLKTWYDTLKGLRDEDFLIAAERVKSAPKLSLYYILINLPDYDKEKDKSIKEYIERRKHMEYTHKISFGLNNSEFEFQNRPKNYVPIDPTM